MKNKLKELALLIQEAKCKKTPIEEWSVGDLGDKIDKNITDKVSLKSIKVGDILVVSNTAILPIAQNNQEKGDAQLTVDSIEGTTIIATPISGNPIEFDILDLRILEAYSMIEVDKKIFVVELPSKVNNNLFKEMHESLSIIDNLIQYRNEIDKLYDKVLTEYEKVAYTGEEKEMFKKSKTVDEVISFLKKEFSPFIESIKTRVGKKNSDFISTIQDLITKVNTDRLRDEYYDFIIKRESFKTTINYLIKRLKIRV